MSLKRKNIISWCESMPHIILILDVKQIFRMKQNKFER